MEFAILDDATAEADPSSEKVEAGSGADRENVPVTQAFSLGWNLARLFVSGTPPARRKPARPPSRLPSPGSLSEAERSHIRLGQVRVAIEHLGSRLGDANADTPLRDVASDELDELLPADDGTASCENPRAKLMDAHLALGRALSCCDGRLSKAYHLGVSLATTCYAPTDTSSLRKEFDPHRTAQIGEWLADLTALFPDHSCRAVRLSCNAWRCWVEESEGRPGPAAANSRSTLRKVKARATGQRPEPEPEPEEEWIEVRRTLARQGEVWRALLSGEKPGTAMLELRDYVAAAARGLGNGMVLVRRLWPVLVLAFSFLVAGVLAVLLLQSPGANVFGIASVAGAIGIVWKGIGGGVGTVAARLQDPVWGAALDEEIATAITVLPGEAKAAAQKPQDVAPASGPPPSDLALHKEVERNEDWAA